MPIVQGQTTTFKLNLLNAAENFTSGSYKIALYDATANLDGTTAAYTTTGEITGIGYTAGGLALVNIPPSSNLISGVAYVSFQNAVWTPAKFSAAGALIYNANTGASVCVLSFGGTKTAANSFTVTFPVNDASTAVIRLA